MAGIEFSTTIGTSVNFWCWFYVFQKEEVREINVDKFVLRSTAFGISLYIAVVVQT